MDDKPVTMPVKHWIIRNMSTRMNVAERIIEDVVNHQFTSAYEAMKRGDETLEFSGWGKFCFKRKNVKKKIEDLMKAKECLEKLINDESLSAQRRHSHALKLITLNKDIELLKPKLNDKL
jgi:nucleoid DNA-binding protein